MIGRRTVRDPRAKRDSRMRSFRQLNLISRSLFSLAHSLELARKAFRVILLGAALFAPGFGQAAENAPTRTSSTVTLSWDKSPGRAVKGYRLRCGLTSGRSYARIVDVGKVTTYTLSNLIPGKTYYCVVTAYNAAGNESPPSNEISFTVSPLTLKKRK